MLSSTRQPTGPSCRVKRCVELHFAVVVGRGRVGECINTVLFTHEIGSGIEDGETEEKGSKSRANTSQGNLTNLHSHKYSGLANSKVVSIYGNHDGGISITKIKADANPHQVAGARSHTTLRRSTGARRANKIAAAETAGKGYRPDLRQVSPRSAFLCPEKLFPHCIGRHFALPAPSSPRLRWPAADFIDLAGQTCFRSMKGRG